MFPFSLHSLSLSLLLYFFLIDAAGLAHGGLDIERLDILPVLPQQRDEEIDRHDNIRHDLLFGQTDMSDGNANAEHLLQLELDGRAHVGHLVLHVLVLLDERWEFARFVQTWAEDARNLAENRLAGKERIILLGELLDELLVLVELLEGLNVFEINADLLGLVAMDLIAEHTEVHARLAFLRQLDGAAETLVLLRIVVLQADLELDCFDEVAFLLDFGHANHVVHFLADCFCAQFAHFRLFFMFGWFLCCFFSEWKSSRK
jgi:hypothetical protein